MVTVQGSGSESGRDGDFALCDCEIVIEAAGASDALSGAWLDDVFVVVDLEGAGSLVVGGKLVALVPDLERISAGIAVEGIAIPCTGGEFARDDILLPSDGDGRGVRIGEGGSDKK